MTTSLFWCSKFNEGFAMSENPGTKTLASPYRWYLGVYIFYQLFALYLRRRSAILNALPLRHWHLAVLFYAVCAAGNLLLLLGTPPGGLAAVSDPSGAMWNIRDILGASALVSIFTMGAFVLFAWLRLAEQNKETPSP